MAGDYEAALRESKHAARSRSALVQLDYLGGGRSDFE
jgi:hypothetical protein